MSRLKIVSIVVLAVLLVVIAIQNTDTVHTKVLLIEVSMPRVVLILAMAVAGFVVGVVVGGRARKKKP